MAISKINSTLSSEEINYSELQEKQRIINDQLYNAVNSIKDAIKCISDLPIVVTEPEAKFYISRIVDEICIHLDEIKRNIQENEK